MRKWFASIAVLGLASAATAQTLGPPPPVGGCGQSQSLLFDDGTAETSWKVRNPTGHKDAFNVDFDDLAGNMTVTGIALNTWQSSSGTGVGIRYVSLCPDNLAVSSGGKTPDVLNPLTQLGHRGAAGTDITGEPGVGAGYCPGFVTYDVPDVSVGTTGGAHAVMSMMSGDSATWLCSDQSSNRKHSYFTSSHYTTPAISLSGNLMMRVVGNVGTGTGSAYMTVNNSAGNVTFSETDDVATTLWSTAAVQPTLYLQGITIPTFIALPNIVLATGLENFAPISDPFQGTICGPAGPPCGFAGFSFGVTAFYIDNADLKKNGNGKIKQTNTVPCTVTPGNPKVCNPCICFGWVDDGTMDGTIWKVQSPAGPADYFSVKMANLDPTSGGSCTVQSNILSVQAASWDFCGTGPSWASVGIYGTSTSLGSGTPDLTNVLHASTGLAMAPNAGDFAYPATTYDFPDVAYSASGLSTTTEAHVAMQWPLGDSCIWIGSDVGGNSDDGGTHDCGSIPSSTSYFTLNGYTSAAVAASYANWMMRIDWN